MLCSPKSNDAFNYPMLRVKQMEALLFNVSTGLFHVVPARRVVSQKFWLASHVRVCSGYVLMVSSP
jgi:hypothetical protein